MNISSLVIYTNSEQAMVLDELSKFKQIEIIAHENDKIVALMSCDNSDEEIATFKKIEAIENVISVAMIYSYQEELQQDIAAIQDAKNNSSQNITQKLNQSSDASQIRYSGELPV